MTVKRLLLAISVIVSSVLVEAQSYTSKETTEYIQTYHKTAIREMYRYKVPASITLAQGVLESGSGRSDLAVKANNHFGIKCGGDYSGKKYYKDDDRKNECFRVYKSADESFRDHSIFMQKSRYSSLFGLKITDYKGWAKGLKECGYATNPKYPTLLIDIIEQNKLYEYDRNPEKYISKKEAEEYSLQDDSKQKDTKPIEDTPTRNDAIISPIVRNNRINGVECVQVKAGDTFYGLSKRLGMSIEQLKQLNDFPANYVLKVGEYVFIQPKKKKSKSQSTHLVQKGESWLSISQLYGIQKDKLKKLNRAKSESISVGKYIRLR